MRLVLSPQYACFFLRKSCYWLSSWQFRKSGVQQRSILKMMLSTQIQWMPLKSGWVVHPSIPPLIPYPGGQPWKPLATLSPGCHWTSCRSLVSLTLPWLLRSIWLILTNNYIHWCRACILSWWTDCVEDETFSLRWVHTGCHCTQLMAYVSRSHPSRWDSGGVQGQG